MQTATANVIKLDAYRRRRLAAPAFPMTWVMVWFVPVVFVRPCLSFG